MSIVARRLWEKRIKSSASSTPAVAAAPGLRVRRRTKHHASGTSSTPNSVPENRQPNPVMPNSAIPSMIRSLPSGGWVVS